MMELRIRLTHLLLHRRNIESLRRLAEIAERKAPGPAKTTPPTPVRESGAGGAARGSGRGMY
ncbi:MAG: hypothetical protein ACRDT4_13995 [Micromonosporaceae bacterium]